MDDKNLVILCVTLIALASMFAMPEQAEKVVIATVSLLGGVAVGKKL